LDAKAKADWETELTSLMTTLTVVDRQLAVSMEKRERARIEARKPTQIPTGPEMMMILTLTLTLLGGWIPGDGDRGASRRLYL